METLEKSEKSLETTGRGEKIDCVWGHATGRLKWRNSDGRIWAKTGQNGRTRKMEDLDRLGRLEQTKEEGRSASPMRPESELHYDCNS